MEVSTSKPLQRGLEVEKFGGKEAQRIVRPCEQAGGVEGQLQGGGGTDEG